MNYKIMIGVLPGYGHENENLTSEVALKIGSESVSKRMPKEMQEECSVILASAVYSTEFGCPAGGELGVELSGKINDENEREILINTVKEMMGDLSQNTVTIEWSEDNKSLGSTYISKGGNLVVNNPATEGVECFSVKIPAENIDFNKIGEKIQDVIEIVNGYVPEKLGKPLYMISGILTEGIDENGKKYYKYSATQNPVYGQTDKDIYQMSTLLTVAAAFEGLGNVIVEFNECNVIVEDKSGRENEKMRTREVVNKTSSIQPLKESICYER